MARILCAWEIGDGHGHVRNLLAVAALLRAAGHQAVFALSVSQVTAIRLVEAAGYIVERFVIPTLPSLNEYLPLMSKYRASSFVDILGLYAFSTVDRLQGVALAMQDIIQRHSIDAVLAESAPVAMLIAKLTQTPCVAVGTSYGLPEYAQGFAPFASLDDAPITALFKERDILAHVNSVSNGHFASLGECFTSARTIPFCYPSMDHYGPQRSFSHRGVGPIWTMPQQTLDKDRYGFAYLQANYPSTPALVSAIRISGIPFKVFVRYGKFSSAGNMQIVDHFVANDELKRATMVVHHGSAGIGQAAMSAGIPQLCLPYHIENTNNAYRLQQLGVSKAIGYKQEQGFTEFLLDDSDDRASNAQVVAKQLADHAQQFPGAQAAAAAIDDLI